MWHWIWGWYPEWYKAKREEYLEQQELITSLCSTDGSLTRARKMCSHAGINMNMATVAMLPAMAEVIEAYRRLDAEAGKETTR